MIRSVYDKKAERAPLSGTLPGDFNFSNGLSGLNGEGSEFELIALFPESESVGSVQSVVSLELAGKPLLGAATND